MVLHQTVNGLPYRTHRIRQIKQHIEDVTVSMQEGEQDPKVLCAEVLQILSKMAELIPDK